MGVQEIYADFTRLTGKIKIMHAVNNAPTVPNDCSGLYGFYKEAGIPFARLHDTGGAFGGSHYVDIPNVFPDFNADPDDPASYDFAFTDSLLCELTAFGVEPFYRLGVTIENNHKIKPYGIIPPADALKWAKICAGIIRHYNRGWADGYRMGIRYWELWNEPDNEPLPEDNPMWYGTAQQYYELYETASRYLKSEFDDVLIGGYASCGFYAIDGEGFVENAKSSTRTGWFIEFFLGFLRYISAPEHRCPFDFFSWHSYADAETTSRHARYCRSKLDEYGFTDTLSIFNEWNPGPNLRGTHKDAGLISEMMCRLQEAPVDMAMYYDGQVHSGYCGIFDPVHYTVFKAYYAFHVWNKLYELKNECFSRSDGNVLCVAATDGRISRLLIVNAQDSDAEINLSLVGLPENAQAECLAVDASHTFTPVEFTRGTSLHIPQYGFRLLSFVNA